MSNIKTMAEGSGYNNKQLSALQKVRGIVEQLIEIEDLQKRKYQSQLGLKGYLDASLADLLLDAYPDYSTLEERLKETITNAKSLGLSKDPLVKKIGALAFS